MQLTNQLSTVSKYFLQHWLLVHITGTFLWQKWLPCGGIDSKSMFLPPKVKKLQTKMLIFTTVHAIVSEDPQHSHQYYSKFFFTEVIFSPKETL